MARFAGYSQSPGSATPKRSLSALTSTTRPLVFGEPRFVCESFSQEKGNAREATVVTADAVITSRVRRVSRWSRSGMPPARRADFGLSRA